MPDLGNSDVGHSIIASWQRVGDRFWAATPQQFLQQNSFLNYTRQTFVWSRGFLEIERCWYACLKLIFRAASKRCQYAILVTHTGVHVTKNTGLEQCHTWINYIKEWANLHSIHQKLFHCLLYETCFLKLQNNNNPDGNFLAAFCVLNFQRAACSTFQTCILNSH